MLRTIVTVVLISICIALVIFVILQEIKYSGFTGTVGGMADSYWGKNKGRSMEGKLVKWTTILTVVFFVLTVVLNMNW